MNQDLQPKEITETLDQRLGKISFFKKFLMLAGITNVAACALIWIAILIGKSNGSTPNLFKLDEDDRRILLDLGISIEPNKEYVTADELYEKLNVELLVNQLNRNPNQQISMTFKQKGRELTVVLDPANPNHFIGCYYNEKSASGSLGSSCRMEDLGDIIDHPDTISAIEATYVQPIYIYVGLIPPSFVSQYFSNITLDPDEVVKITIHNLSEEKSYKVEQNSGNSAKLYTSKKYNLMIPHITELDYGYVDLEFTKRGTKTRLWLSRLQIKELMQGLKHKEQ